MKKLLLIITICVLNLDAAADQVDIKVKQQQEQLLQLGIDFESLHGLARFIGSFDLAMREPALKGMETLLQPGGDLYELSKPISKTAYYAIQQSSEKSEKEIVSLCAAMSAKRFLDITKWRLAQSNSSGQLKSFAQAYIDNMDRPQERAETKKRVKMILKACQFQKEMQVPLIKEEAFDNLYQEGMKECFAALTNAAFHNCSLSGPSFERDAALSDKPFNDQEVNEFVDMYVVSVKESFQKILSASESENQNLCPIQ